MNTADGQQLRLRMQLIGTQWKITRAWLPKDMLSPRHPT